MKLNKNMGKTDITIRLVVAVLYFTNVISSTLALILGFFAVIFVVTSLFSFCPLYLPFKFSTRKE